MFNYFKKKVIQWVREDWENERQKSIGSNSVVSVREFDRPEQMPVLNFRIYNAVNGQLLEFTKYDRKNDQNTSTLYLIEKDKELADYVAKCVSMELLK